MIKKECRNCKHMTIYKAVYNEDDRIYICSGDGYDDGDDGTYLLTEVSEFDATNCILFKEQP